MDAPDNSRAFLMLTSVDGEPLRILKSRVLSWHGRSKPLLGSAAVIYGDGSETLKDAVMQTVDQIDEQFS